MSRMVYANFSIRTKAPNGSVTEKELDSFNEIWDANYKGYTDDAPSLYKHFASDGVSIYARADVGRNFDPSFMLEFTKAHPHLQMEVIEEDYDEDSRCRYLLEGEILEKLNEVRYYEQPKLIDWPS